MEVPATRTTAHRTIVGSIAALLSMALLTAAMLPVRDHLSIATAALVLVLPVVVGVASGGFVAGVISVIGGFLAYNYFFIPPYWNLHVGAAENWVALAVYAIVMIPIAHVFANMISARTQAQHRGAQLRRLFEVSGQLIEDRPLDELLNTVVEALREIVDARQVALLLPRETELDVAAAAGEPLTDQDREHLRPLVGQLSGLGVKGSDRQRPVGLALVAGGRPVGILAISGAVISDQQQESLRLFANQAALAIERAQLREQALRTQLADEITRLARTLVAAASHDLRSPLASIKAASSVLADAQLVSQLDGAQQRELAVVIDMQADRLAALVTSLLDMGRIQAGALRPRTAPITVAELIHSVVDPPRPEWVAPPSLELVEPLPPVLVDAALIGRVLANLLDNAYRHAPHGTPVVISAEQAPSGTVTVRVIDRGPGVNPDRRNEIFGFYVRRSGDSGTGLGLAIAKTFIDAHHQRIWVEPTPTGATFCFTLPVAAQPSLAA